jgi:hypothetical protein
MIIDLKNKAFGNRLKSAAVILFILAATISVAVLDFENNKFLGLTKTHYYIILPVVFILYLIIMQALIKPHYIYFNDEGSKIIIRYFPLSAFIKKKNSVEILRSNLYKIETNKKFMREELILFIKLKDGVAKYPPINIGSLSKKQKQQMLASLNSISMVKK